MGPYILYSCVIQTLKWMKSHKKKFDIRQQETAWDLHYISLSQYHPQKQHWYLGCQHTRNRDV